MPSCSFYLALVSAASIFATPSTLAASLRPPKIKPYQLRLESENPLFENASLAIFNNTIGIYPKAFIAESNVNNDPLKNGIDISLLTNTSTTVLFTSAPQAKGEKVLALVGAKRNPGLYSLQEVNATKGNDMSLSIASLGEENVVRYNRWKLEKQKFLAYSLPKSELESLNARGKVFSDKWYAAPAPLDLGAPEDSWVIRWHDGSGMLMTTYMPVKISVTKPPKNMVKSENISPKPVKMVNRKVSSKPPSSKVKPPKRIRHSRRHIRPHNRL